MKKIIIFLVLILLCSNVFAFKVATYNIQNGLQHSDSTFRKAVSFAKHIPPRTTKKVKKGGNFLEGQNVDVVMLTEVDGGSLRTLFIDLWTNERTRVDSSKYFGSNLKARFFETGRWHSRLEKNYHSINSFHDSLIDNVKGHVISIEKNSDCG